MLSAEASGEFFITGKVWKDGGKPHMAGLISRCFSFAISEIEEEIAYLDSIGRGEEAEEKEACLILLYDPAFSSSFSEAFKRKGQSVADSLSAAFGETATGSGIGELDLSELAALLEEAFDNEDYIPNEGSDAYILVVRRLTMETLKRIDPDAISLVVCEKGSASSHAAMFLKTLGVPALFGVAGIYDKVDDGDVLRIDCFNSDVFSGGENWYFDKSASVGAPENTLTKDKKAVRILATINQAVQARSVGFYTWDGVGLVRTEFLFARTNAEPSVWRQRFVYQSIADWSSEGNILFRLFDFGEDKSAAWISDENRAEVYSRQIEALLPLAQKRPISILIPKTSSKEQVEAIRASIHAKSRASDTVRLGSMIETLSGVASAKEIIEASDFINIGTNDLSAESIGVRRDEADASTVFMEPKFLRNMKAVLDAAEESKKPVTVCGEMMRSRQCCYLLIGLGIGAMSVELRKIPETRSFVSSINASEAKASIPALLACPTQSEVHSRLLNLAF